MVHQTGINCTASLAGAEQGLEAVHQGRVLGTRRQWGAENGNPVSFVPEQGGKRCY